MPFVSIRNYQLANSGKMFGLGWERKVGGEQVATCVLDFYHATEHLSDFCNLFKNKSTGKIEFRKWCKMLYDGEILQMHNEMKNSLEEKVSNRDEALKHYNYFENNMKTIKIVCSMTCIEKRGIQ